MIGAIYQVKNWDTFFEGAKSKTYNNKTKCSMPCKHGLGFKRLVKRPNGPALFGAWCALIQILSRHNKERDGYCTDTGRADGAPYSFDDLEMLTDIPSFIFEEMFQICTSKPVGWVTVTQAKDTIRNCTDTVGDLKDTLVPLNSNSNSNSNYNSKPEKSGEEQRLLSRFPEYENIKNSPVLKKITLERYARIASDFPNVNRASVIKLACLKADDPDTKISKPDSWLIAQFKHAPDKPKTSPMIILEDRP